MDASRSASLALSSGPPPLSAAAAVHRHRGQPSTRNPLTTWAPASAAPAAWPVLHRSPAPHEGGALADKNTVKHTDSLDSSGTATTADVQMTDVSETALKVVSPETGSTITATAVKASPLGVGTRRSARACAGAKRTATESGVKSVRFSASYAEVVSEI